MALKIHWTGNAKKQLKRIFEYYKENASYKVATTLSEDIVKQTLKLIEQPLIGPREQYLKDRTQDFRFLVFKKLQNHLLG